MSPIIIVGLVLLWAVVLVPMWLRRHEESEEHRSVDRFASAMRTLSRREQGLGRYVVAPHRNRDLMVHVSGASDPDADDDWYETPSLRERLTGPLAALAHRRAGRRPEPWSDEPPVERRVLTAADRRRRCLLSLTTAVLVLLVVAAAVTEPVLWGLQIVADALLVGYLVVLRLGARGRAAVARPRAVRLPATAAQRRTDSRPAGREEAAGPVGRRVRPASPVVSPAAAGSQPSPAVADAWSSYDEPVDGVLDDDEWQPVPVPPPTYTMKPAAPARRRPVREVELAPDVEEPAVGWTIAANAEAEAAAVERETGVREADTEDLTDEMALLDDILTRRRAVND